MPSSDNSPRSRPFFGLNCKDRRSFGDFCRGPEQQFAWPVGGEPSAPVRPVSGMVATSRAQCASRRDDVLCTRRLLTVTPKKGLNLA